MHRSSPAHAVLRITAILALAAAYAVAGPPQSALAAAPSIPDSALLQPADLNGATLADVTDDDLWPALRPPKPCADRPYPSSGLVRARRTASVMIGVGDRPTVVMEYVALYHAGGARRYLNELRRALVRCGTAGPEAPRWTTLASSDESLLLARREYVDYAETYKTSYLFVARTGRALVVVADVGWETGNGHREIVPELGVAAVRRAAALGRT